MTLYDQHHRRILALERQISSLRLMQTATFVLVALLLIAVVRGDDIQLALADRAQYPPEHWPNLYYVSIETTPADDRQSLATALHLVVPSMSRQVVLERCLPAVVGETLYRLDLSELQWDRDAWLKHVAADYPYAVSANPLLVRGDWLLLQLSDAVESDAYYALTFPGAKTRDEALAVYNVETDPQFRFGMIEGRSGVSVQGVRWIENRPVSRGYAWLTRDSKQLDGDSDMLERPDGTFVHDGEEVILGVRKISLRTGTQGTLQVYFLADGQGNLVDRAPTDLVVDHTEFRGLPEIRNPGSCIQCHGGGLNPLTQNELRRYVEKGVEAYGYGDAARLESFHFADLETDLLRDSSDYQAIVLEATGVDSETAAKRFREAVARYERRLGLVAAADELHADPNELRLALAWAAAKGTSLGARVSGLAYGETVPRAAWEESYLIVKAVMADWRNR